MGLCWKYWPGPDPGGFPVFSGGSLLFCKGELAETCCQIPYYYNCYSPDDDSDGYEEDPCEIPDHWTGGYDIFAVCDAYEEIGCQKGPRPSITVPSGVGGCELDYAVLCEWLLGRVSWTIENAGFNGAGTMLVTVHGNTFSTAISFTKGETKTFYVDIPEEYGNAFGNESNVLTIKTRIQLSYPDERYWDVMSYVWCEEYPGNRVPGSIVILPNILAGSMVYAEGGVGDPEDRSWRLYLTRMKSGYETWGAASAVFTEYYDDLKAYAESCACDMYGIQSCWIVCDLPGGYDESLGLYRLEHNAHEGGCSGVITGEDWWELSGIYAVSPVQIIIKNLETGVHWNWDGGDMMLPPCHELGFYIADLDDFIEGGGCSGDAERISPPEDCTTAIICAFCNVPGNTHIASCEECE